MSTNHGDDPPKMAQNDQDPPKSSRNLPLFREPLSSQHSAEEKVAAMRAAIEAGADVNQLDQEPIVGYNEGRPLDVCVKHNYTSNLGAIELLLQHGADPRLHARPTLMSPLRRVAFYAEYEHSSEEQRVFCKRVLALFEEAIARLEEVEKGKK